MKLLKNITTGAAAAGLTLSLGGRAEAAGRTYIDNTAVKGGTLNMGLIMTVLVVVLMLLAMTWFVRRSKSGGVNLPWAVLSAVLAALALLLCIAGSYTGTLYTRAEGDPADTVRLFYDSLMGRDYVAAYSCLSDYATLGLETPPETENAKKAYEALRNSYDYSISGPAQVDELSAEVKLRFRYLDMPSFEESVASRTNTNLEEFVKNNPVSKVYDKDDNYLPEVTEKAYADALEFILDKADTYYTSTELVIKLEYINEKWLIVTDEAMLNALVGGTVY